MITVGHSLYTFSRDFPCGLSGLAKNAGLSLCYADSVGHDYITWNTWEEGKWLTTVIKNFEQHIKK